MCYEIEEFYRYYSETRRTTRVPRRCAACDVELAPGHVWWHVVIFQPGGEIEHLCRCDRCQALHLHLREKSSWCADWPDERLSCGTRYEDVYGDIPPEILALAFWQPGEPV
jgi:hypothetical protein